MRIGLIDIDYNGSFPNIPLMKLSAWHKQIGNTVEWYDPISGHFDIVYVSKVFSWSPDYQYPIDADKIIKGGSGYWIENFNGKETWYGEKSPSNTFLYPGKYQEYLDNVEYPLELPKEIEHIYPDYSLYPKLTKDTAYGFLTRGCPRGCSFCHVAAKEGKCSHKVADLNEFWHGQKKIVLCDPNLLACKEWKQLLQQLIDSNATLDINQGLDARMLTREKAEMLCRCKIDQVHFAWDRYEDGKVIVPKLRLFREVWEAKRLWNEHGKVVFVLVNYDTTPEQDLDRVYKLRELGYWAYIMVYDKKHSSNPFYKDLARWVNDRPIFAVCKTLEEYIKNKRKYK